MNKSEQRWHIIFTRQAETALRQLPPALLRHVDQVILALTENPRPSECQALVGADNLYRLRVESWRIAYAVEDDRQIILILEIAPKQRPMRYRLAEEGDEVFLPQKPSRPEGTAWYLFYCRSGYEEKVRKNLLYRTESMAMQDKIFQVVVPTAGEIESSHRQEKRISPGWILIQMFLDEDSWYVVKNTPGIGGFIGSGDKPSPLHPDKLDKLLQRIKAEEVLRQTIAENQKFLADLLVERPHQEKIRVLIVDDLAETRENLRKLLFFESDIEVIGAATNGEEAVQMAVEQQPDLVLMDLLLPGIDGITAAERILQQVPSTKVIMMSVQGEADVFRRAMMAGAKEFLIKPFSSDELVSSIRRVHQLAKPHRVTPEGFEEILFGLTALTELIGTDEANLLKRKMLLDKPLWFLKKQKLGQAVEISLSVDNLSESLTFYQTLGLEKVDGRDQPYPWAVLSDGLLHLGLYQTEFPSPTLSYYSYTGILDQLIYLKKLGVQLENIQTDDFNLQDKELYNLPLDFIEKIEAVEFTFEEQCVRLTTPGFWFSNVKGHGPFRRPQKFGELSFKTEDINTALAYWEQLGFKQVSKIDKPYPSAVVSDGLIRLGFHQTCNFTKPTITYFAPDMPQRLDHLREQGIEVISEQKDAKGQPVGAMIESPDGQPFFLFAGEVKV